jgi:hypothetical protein
VSINPALGFTPAGTGANARAYVTTDYQVIRLQGVAGADGTCVIASDPVDSGYIWRIEHKAIEANPTQAAAQCFVYIGPSPTAPTAAQIGSLVDYSDAVPAISDDGEPLTVPSNEYVVYEFFGLPVGAKVTARMQVAVLQFAPAGT